MLPEDSGGQIRKRAEEIARHKIEPGDSPQDKLIYELTVHQIELEMQNSELQRSQEELQRSRQRYEQLFDWAPVAYFVFNTEGAILEANHAAASLVNAERTYLDRKPFVVFLAQEYHTLFFTHLRRVFELGQRQTAEIQIRNRGGDTNWVRLESRRQESVKGGLQCLTTVVDLTDRKRIEDDLILARDDAVTASRAKSVFLANISHEIRTPMSGILGMSELALEQHAENEELTRYVTTIHSAARSLLSILDDVRDVTRIESDQIDIDRRPFRVGELLSTVEAMFQPIAAQKRLTLAIETPPSMSEVLAGDRNRIRQVVVNLLSNALRFTESGSVTLRLREDEVSDFVRELTFEVADTGPGISVTEQRRIFESFNRALHDQEARYEGSGVGLAISRRLAQLMGGQLYFETVPGSGSRFFFSVPLELPAPEPTETAARIPSSERTGDRGRILVAEDNAINLLVIRTVLEKAGYQIISVGNGRDAIARLERERFDLVLMDISMPGMDGIEATQAIRARRGDDSIQWDVPIIAISAHSMKGDRERFLQAGMNDYISKPFVRETILNAVTTHTGTGE
ncbi:MAG: response regulator [Alkalispirochaeta sp.]